MTSSGHAYLELVRNSSCAAAMNMGWQARSPTHTKQTQHLDVPLSPDCQCSATKCTLLTCFLCPQWPLVRHRHCGCPFPGGLTMWSLIPGGRYLTLMTLSILRISPMVGSLLYSCGWVYTRVKRTSYLILQLLSIFFFFLTGPHCGALAGLKLRTLPAEFQGPASLFPWYWYYKHVPSVQLFMCIL